MPTFEENMNTLLAGLTLEQVTALAEAAKRKQSEMEKNLIHNAKVKFIKAYQEFRNLAPNATGYFSMASARVVRTTSSWSLVSSRQRLMPRSPPNTAAISCKVVSSLWGAS